MKPQSNNFENEHVTLGRKVRLHTKKRKKKVTEIDQIFCINIKVEWEYFPIYHHFPSEIDIIKFKHLIMKKTSAWFFVTFCHFFFAQKTDAPSDRASHVFFLIQID